MGTESLAVQLDKLQKLVETLEDRLCTLEREATQSSSSRDETERKMSDVKYTVQAIEKKVDTVENKL